MVHFLGNRNTKQTSVYFGNDFPAQSLCISQFSQALPALFGQPPNKFLKTAKSGDLGNFFGQIPAPEAKILVTCPRVYRNPWN